MNLSLFDSFSQICVLSFHGTFVTIGSFNELIVRFINCLNSNCVRMESSFGIILSGG